MICNETSLMLYDTIICARSLTTCNCVSFTSEVWSIKHACYSRRKCGIALCDDDDMQREIRNLFTRTNILVRRFASCSVDVKIILFKAYCISLYDAGLWKRYKVTMFNKLSSCYNKCLKLLFGYRYRRRDSVTQILFNLGIPSFNTVVHNSKALAHSAWCNCCNTIVRHLGSTLHVAS